MRTFHITSHSVAGIERDTITVEGIGAGAHKAVKEYIAKHLTDYLPTGGLVQSGPADWTAECYTDSFGAKLYISELF